MKERIHDQETPSTVPERTITVREADLTVGKAIAPYREDVVKVRFTIDSVADKPLGLRLTDPLPAGVEMDSVGFHPQYDPDGWQVGDGRSVVYESVVSPGESRETVYGARVGTGVEVEPFAVEPALEVAPVDDGVDEAGGPSADDDGMVFDPDAGDDAQPDSPSEYQQDADSDAPADEPIDETRAPSGTSVAEPSAPAPDAVTNGGGTHGDPGSPEPSSGPADDAEVSIGVTDEDGPSQGGSASSADREPLVDDLLDELRQRELSADERAMLREVLGLEASPSEAARLDHVQATVDDLVAYRDALEGFIDEHGPSEALVEEFRSTFADHAEDLDRLESAVDDLQARLERLEETQVADAERFEERLSTVETELSADLAALDDDLESVQGELHRLQEWREKLSVAAQLADTGVQSDTVAD